MTYPCKQALNTTRLNQKITVETPDPKVDSWEAVAKNVESAISVMETVAQYVGQHSRNRLSYSLKRCYHRAKSIREIRGIMHIEDRTDHDHFRSNKCMLGNYLRGDF